MHTHTCVGNWALPAAPPPLLSSVCQFEVRAELQHALQCEPPFSPAALTRAPWVALPPPAPQVEVPAELQSSLKDSMQAAGIPLPSSNEAWQQALHALKVGGLTGELCVVNASPAASAGSATTSRG